MSSKYSFVIWDWNGTLIDDATVCFEIFDDIQGQYGIKTRPHDEYRRLLTHPIKEFYVRCGFDFDQLDYSKIAHDYHVLYTERRYECGLRRGGPEALERFRGLGVPQYVLSSHHQTMLEEMIDHFQLVEYFEKVVGLSDRLAASKTDSGRELVSEVGGSLGAGVMVGDSVHDFEVASELGLDCILVSGGLQCASQLKECGVPVIEELEQLDEVLN